MKSLILLTVFTLSLGSTSLALAGNAGGAGEHPNRAARRERIMALPQEERTRLRNAFQATRNDPTFQAARQAGDKRAMRMARRDAMLKADPGIGPILDKVRGPGAGRR